jgi:hypothetical protein
MNSHHLRESDLDMHQSKKPDTDLHPSQKSRIQIPIHIFLISVALEVHNRARKDPQENLKGKKMEHWRIVMLPWKV